MQRISLSTLCLSIALALMVGCGGEEAKDTAAETPAATPAEEAPAEPQANQAPPPLAPRTTPAQELRRDLELPSYYPWDAPRYPGATASHQAQSSDGRANLLFGSDDSVSDVERYMEQFFRENDWTSDGAQPAPDGVMMSGSKGDRGITVMVRRINDGQPDAITMIAVTVDQER